MQPLDEDEYNEEDEVDGERKQRGDGDLGRCAREYGLGSRENVYGRENS